MKEGIEEYKQKHKIWNLLNFAAVEGFWGIGIGLTSMSVVIAVFLAQLGASKMLIGCLPLVWGVFPSIPQVLAGYFTEHMGRKKATVTLGHFAPVLTWLILGLYLLRSGAMSPGITIAVFFVCYAFYSLCFGFLIPLWGNFIGKVLPSGSRGLGFGTMFFATAIFGVLGAEMARRILKSGVPFPQGYAYCFLLTFGFCAIGNLFFIPVREAPQEETEKPRNVGLYLKNLFGTILRNRDLRFLILSKIFALGSIIVSVFYGVYARDEIKMDNATIAGLARISFTTQAIGCILLGWLADRLNYKSVILLGRGFSLASAMLLCTCGGAWTIRFVAAAEGISWAAFSVTDMNMIMRLAKTDRSTGFLGGVYFIISPFIALFPVLAGRLIDLVNYETAFAMAAVLVAIGMALLAFWVCEPKETVPAASVVTE